MPGISRVGLDTAGGLIIGILQTKVKLENRYAVVIGAAIQSHGSGSHGSAIMNGGSSKVFIQGIGVCRQSDNASCGHIATGSSKVFAG